MSNLVKIGFCSRGRSMASMAENLMFLRTKWRSRGASRASSGRTKARPESLKMYENHTTPLGEKEEFLKNRPWGFFSGPRGCKNDPKSLLGASWGPTSAPSGPWEDPSGPKSAKRRAGEPRDGAEARKYCVLRGFLAPQRPLPDIEERKGHAQGSTFGRRGLPGGG